MLVCHQGCHGSLSSSVRCCLVGIFGVEIGTHDCELTRDIVMGSPGETGWYLPRNAQLIEVPAPSSRADGRQLFPYLVVEGCAVTQELTAPATASQKIMLTATCGAPQWE